MRKGLVPRPLLDRASYWLKLIAEPARLEILNLLQARGDMNVQDLVRATGQSQANVSKHLGLMLREGLIARRQEGLFAYYSINDPTIAAICLLVCARIGEADRQAAERSPARPAVARRAARHG